MKKLIAANWKMNKTVEEAVSAIKELKMLVKGNNDSDIVVCPPFTSLCSVVTELKGSTIRLGAQNMYFEEYGAYTGEISPLMLIHLGCEFVILGHSERRELFGENDELINKKVISALKHSLSPILCIGENSEQRQQNQTNKVLYSQLRNCLKDIEKKQITNISVAYEPIWAISKGNPNHKAATSDDAEQGHKFIRSVIREMFDGSTAKKIRIIYGGSMKPENSKELLSMPNIDGGLIGNASLNAKSFADIVKSAE